MYMWYLPVVLLIQIAIVRLTTHNHQEEQDLDETEVIKMYLTFYHLLYIYATAPSLSTKMYCVKKVRNLLSIK